MNKFDCQSFVQINWHQRRENMSGSPLHSDDKTGVLRYGGLQIREDDCSYVWQIKPSDRCEWVKNQETCDSDSLVQYTRLLFCTFGTDTAPGLFALGLFIIALWLLYLFLMLATTADNFFCPSLGVIAGVLHLSENIAGVTILAFGNGAPDIFTSLVSDQREMVLMFTELIGAGIFVTAIIAGSVAVVAPFRVPVKSFTRDSSFYIFSVCWISYISQDQVVHLWEALSFVLIYILFIVVVIAMQCYDNREEKQKERIPRFQEPELLKTYVAYQTSQTDPRKKLPLRTRAYSLQAKLDVAIAAEMASSGDTRDTRNEVDDESRSSRPTGLIREFLYDVNPVNSQDWRESNRLAKAIIVLRAPIMFFLQLFIPVVNETAEKRGWSKLLNCLQLVILPLLFLFKFNVWRMSIGPLPIMPVILIPAVILACVIFLITDMKPCPKYHDIFAFLGFIGAMLIVYVTANEVMAVLQCIGYASGISDAMLGITLLAWGNSVGDLISNVAIARRGFPRMGYSACFGGPLFNTLLGLGLSWTISAVQSDDYRTKIRASDMMPGCLAFLMASLATSIVYLNLVGFAARRSYGFLLYSVYFVFIVINFLSEIRWRKKVMRLIAGLVCTLPVRLSFGSRYTVEEVCTACPMWLDPVVLKKE